MDPSHPDYAEFVQWRDNAMRLLADALNRLHEQQMVPPPAPKIDRTRPRTVGNTNIRPRSLLPTFDEAA